MKYLPTTKNHYNNQPRCLTKYCSAVGLYLKLFRIKHRRLINYLLVLFLFLTLFLQLKLFLNEYNRISSHDSNKTNTPRDKSSPISKLARNSQYRQTQLIGFAQPYLFNSEFNKNNNELDAKVYNNLKEISTFNNTIQVAKTILTLSPSLKTYRNQLIKYYPSFTKAFDDKPLNSEAEIISKNWYEFNGGSIFLSILNCHFMVSRINYSKSSKKNLPFISFLGFKLIDRNFNEIRENFKFKYGPNSHQISNMINFPSIHPIPNTYFSIDQQQQQQHGSYGPQDLKIIIKESYYEFYYNGEKIRTIKYEEPLIIFNMKTDESFSFNNMIHGYLPFQNKKIVFTIVDNKLRKQSGKTWSPFFDSAFKNVITINVNDPQIIHEFENQRGSLNDIKFDFKFTNGYINFVYSLNPLRILKCNLDTGNCGFIHQSIDSAHLDNYSNQNREIESGTSLVELKVPKKAFTHLELDMRKIEQNLNKYTIWVGFSKTHLYDCGCSSQTYRPSLTVLFKERGTSNYKTELFSSSIDFNLNVASWDATSNQSCEGPFNLLVPNSISYWDAKEDINANGEYEYEDYMAVAISEADSNNIVVHLKGILKYLLQLPFFQKEDTLLHTKLDSSLLMDFSLRESAKYCEEYGRNNGGRIPSTTKRKSDI
ncbi:glycosyltransferase family 91 protein [Ascoidea rubescens DSM 1968]|uniref:Glycosyltransferase family 91 protein n=1 Tax=Ascoidea rubescens DSM 1968 TaxID=1344418 RepID=A0A1D2VR75_9ASCO|nr:glycosyltransferase family 91 protein [Ascoidea rubescens DSM 1968]ODV64112.1 glycosyltransferase family 91 protein [Ascoidea rubescens DSM 1968]